MAGIAGAQPALRCYGTDAAHQILTDFVYGADNPGYQSERIYFENFGAEGRDVEFIDTPDGLGEFRETGAFEEIFFGQISEKQGWRIINRNIYVALADVAIENGTGSGNTIPAGTKSGNIGTPEAGFSEFVRAFNGSTDLSEVVGTFTRTYAVASGDRIQVEMFNETDLASFGLANMLNLDASDFFTLPSGTPFSSITQRFYADRPNAYLPSIINSPPTNTPEWRAPSIQQRRELDGRY